mmetsp:Transcript_10613/g.10260  ORF Transcript_10613/g.10260 Transcript_10613/m.10260 type:complete len:216 (-) Transcript_10613:684-1331(-)|eukprot:CAMPEP_0119039232 /NCGR_PEP_ID=MMETSP1177-20130426/8638_1 /TAXON_ID=2985 /ORGANISM="Ochromonas sp, Strain CCMP1899" /LENGTH=215 /DNA_ID=CAMNT_0007002885 /DNA_START=238 /DNA_END=885 /DNA_ORIENTATION=-
MEDLINSITAEKVKLNALQIAYDDEKLLRIKTENSLEKLKKAHETLASKTEMEEENLVKKLLSKLDAVKRDSAVLAVGLEKEEEWLTNNLQRQLRVLQTEKEGVEAEVGDLKKQLDSMKVEREKMARSVEAEEELLSNKLFKKISKVQHEKDDLETQLSRSWSRSGSMCSGSPNTSLYLGDLPIRDSPSPSVTDSPCTSSRLSLSLSSPGEFQII